METRLKSIICKIENEIPKFKDAYKIDYLGIFGSFIRDEQKNTSDLDILISFSTPPTLFEFIRLKNFLTEITGVEVDLVMKTSLKPSLEKSILDEAMQIA